MGAQVHSGLQAGILKHPSSSVRRAHLDSQRDGIVSDKIDKLAITKVPEDTQSFVSPFFVVPKSDGSWHPLVNLQALNQHQTPLQNGIYKISEGSDSEGRLASKAGLKGCISNHPSHRRYLRFRWKDHLWQFKVLPFRLSSSPCTFIKIMKPVLATLRRLGVRVVLYLDNMLMMSSCKSTAREHMKMPMDLLSSLGFLINVEKSVISPSQQLEFLGFRLDSCSIMISLPARTLILGTMVVAHPAPLHYKHLERIKTLYLWRIFSYDQAIPIHHSVKLDLCWWTEQIKSFNGHPLQISGWNVTLEADASMLGWGGLLSGTESWWPMDCTRAASSY